MSSHSDAHHDDFNSVPVRELPGRLPEGERVLWQGAPMWKSLFWRAYYGRLMAIYFSILIASRGISVLANGGDLAAAAIGMLWLAPLAIAGMGLMAGVAWFSARASYYTITNKRVVMRIGVVLEITFNFPFTVIESAGLRMNGEGTGDLPLQFKAGENIAYLHLWPHARPWQFKRTQPMLRSVAEPQKVARLLADALAAETEGLTPKVAIKSTPRHAPAPSSAMSAAGY